MIVAGLLLTRMTSSPSSLSALQACVPEESNSHPWPMTIGPDPMTRTRLMSVRLGMFQIWRPCIMTPGCSPAQRRTSAPFFHDVEKLPEQVVGVVRARCGLGMVLHAEHRLRLVPESLDRAVVEIDGRDSHIFRQGPRGHPA